MADPRMDFLDECFSAKAACRGVNGLSPGKVAEIVRAARRVVDIWHDPKLPRDDGTAELAAAVEGVEVADGSGA